MRSSLLEMKVKQIASLNPGGLYIVKMNKQPDAATMAYMNQYFQRVYNETKTTFIILGGDGVDIIGVDGQLSYFEKLVEEVLIKHGIIRSAQPEEIRCEESERG